MRVLLTGATGYAGRGIAQILSTEYVVRGLDIRAGESALDELIVGDLTDLDTCRRALEGMEAMVLCHMAPNPVAYQAPPLAFDINVKGTANLYHAAVEHGITRCVLISTEDVVDNTICRTPAPGAGPYNFQVELYGITKIQQEVLARYYYEKHHVNTAVLRPGWIIYDQDFVTKYGWTMDHYEPTLIDPRDIGAAVAAALALPDLSLEAFQLCQDDSPYDHTSAYTRLNWQPRYRFKALPRTSPGNA